MKREPSVCPAVPSTRSLRAIRLLQLMLALPFVMAAGCGIGTSGQSTTEQATQDVATDINAEAEESAFSKGASPASTPSEAAPVATPIVAEQPPETPDASETEEPTEFTDIAELPNKEIISTLQQLQVFDGTNGKFRPYDSITRGEYVIWMFKANNALRRETEHLRPAPNFNPDFSDIDASHPAYRYVQAFANAGYAVGYDDNTFKPDQPITREEMIALKVGLDTRKDHEPIRNRDWLKFSDADQIDERYTGFIWDDRIRKNGARAFGTVRNFKPKQAVMRHEAAATLARVEHSAAERALERKIREQKK